MIKLKQKMGKKRTSVFLFLLFMCFGIFLCQSASYASETKQAKEAETSAVDMAVTYGFGDTAKGDRYLPVWVELNNRMTERFEGTLEILTTASSMETYRYDYEVAASSGNPVRYTLCIPLGIRSDQLFVILKDPQGKEIVKKRLKLIMNKDVIETFIGVFSDSPENLDYLNERGLHYGALKTKLISLEQNMVMEEARGYDQMDLLIVTDYDLNRLTDTQQNAVMQWVENGGTLLFGGGSRYKEGMGKFARELSGDFFMEPSQKSVNLGVEYSQEKPQDSVLELVCTDPELRGESTLISGDEFPLLSSSRRGRGRILAAAFELGDIAQFCKENPAFLEKFLLLVFGERKVQKLAQPDYYGFSNLYFAAQGLINTGDTKRLPNVAGYTFVMLFYVALIGPILYLFLKKRSMQKYYIGGVAVCSLIFTGMVYVMGMKTRFKTPFFTYATILDVSEHQIKESSYINVRSPLNKPYQIDLKPAYTVRPITKSYYYESSTLEKFTGEENYKTAISYKDSSTEVRIRDAAAFTPKMFALNRQKPKGNAAIESDLSAFDQQVRGTVTNRSEYRLEDMLLLFYGRAVRLGDLEPGETVNVEGHELITYPLNYMYAFSQWATGADQYEKADISNPVYMKAQERARLLSFYMEQNLTEYTPQVRLIAFCPEKNDQEFLADGTFTADGRTMITSSVRVKREKGGKIFRSALEQEPKVVSGNYQSEYNSMYTGEPSGPLVLEYSLGNDLEIEQVTFEPLSSNFVGDPRYPYLSAFHGNLYFYNYNTGHHDRMDSAKVSYTAKELKAYLSPNNTLTVKYVNESSGEYEWDSVLPLIYVTGREK